MPVRTDLEHGGRWTSLVLGGREWLWHRPDPARNHVRPGDPFVDAGGLEECLPTIRGCPDHGAVWSRAWIALDRETARVDLPGMSLERRLSNRADTVLARYRLRAAPGTRFVWAAHALLDLSEAARLSIGDHRSVRIYPDAGSAYRESGWPPADGPPLDVLGPADGTAVGAVITGCSRARVIDGDQTLELTLEAPGQPVSTALWRNLGGFPAAEPYRSIGVEPMIGGVFDLAAAKADDDAGTVPASGEVSWVLRIEATPV